MEETKINFYQLVQQSQELDRLHDQHLCAQDCINIYQIKKDVPRTTSVFSESNRSILDIDISSGLNPIYNILTAYARFDPEIGYTQGMNFLAALIFQAVGDEVIAFAVLLKVMYQHNWRDCYKDQLVKLMSITRKIKQWLMKNHKTIAVHLDFCGVILEAQLSSPVMGLFANLLSCE